MNGIKNCHAIGVDSVAWENGRGGYDRIFIANEYHELYTNIPNSEGTMSVGFHNHRNDLRIRVLDGVINELLLFDQKSKQTEYDCIDITVRMDKYMFSSYITRGEQEQSNFTKIESELLGFKHCIITLGQGSDFTRNASEFHTIHIPKGRTAIWKVEELSLNPFHAPTVLSNDYRLDQFGFPDRMYLPMSESQLKHTMQKIIRLL